MKAQKSADTSVEGWEHTLTAPVDEAVDAVLENALHLLLHLLLLGHLDLGHLGCGVHAHPGAEDLRDTHTHVTGVNGTALVLALSAWARPYLDLVCVHAGVGDEDVGVLDPFGLVHSDPLVQQKACEEQEEQSHDHYYSCAAFWLAEPHTVNQSHNFHRSIWTPVVTDTLQTHYYYLRWDNEYI